MHTLDLSAFPPGATARPLTRDDLPAFVGARNAYAHRLLGVEPDSLKEWEPRFAAPGFDPSRDTVGVFGMNGAFLAAAISANSSQPHVESHLSFVVDDDALGHADHGVPHAGEQALLAWAVDVQKSRVDEAPAGAKVVAGFGALDQDRRRQSVAESLGFDPRRLFIRMKIEMTEAPTVPPFPEGLHVTTLADGIEVDAVALAVDDAFSDHFGYAKQPEEELTREWRYWVQSDPRFDPSLWFLAMDGSEIAGICMSQLETDEDTSMSYIMVLGVRKPWRKQGLGNALLRHSFAEFYRRGKRKAALDVDSESLTGATRLYRKAGMGEDRRFVWRELVLRDGKDLRRLD